MIEELIADIESKLVRVSGRTALRDCQRRDIRSCLNEIKSAWTAEKLRHADMPGLDRQAHQVSALASALGEARSAVLDLHPGLWEAIALEQDLPSEVTRDLLKASRTHAEASALALKHLGALTAIRDAAGTVAERLAAGDAGDGARVPVMAVVERMGHLYISVTGSFPPIQSTGVFVRCVHQVIDWIEPGVAVLVPGDAIRRAVRHCMQQVWLELP